MYPQTGLAQTQSNGVGSVVNYPTDAPRPIDSGIASTLQSLTEQVIGTVKLAYSVRVALGIQSPEAEVKQPKSPSSLIECLAELRRKLLAANSDLETVINHINS